MGEQRQPVPEADMFTIETESLRMDLEVVRVDTLFLHERILPSMAQTLILEFRNWTNLHDPIIIDRNNIVLDGNHRAFVFRELKIRYIAACRIDYFDEKARLRYWFRRLWNLENLDVLMRVLEECGADFDEVPSREAMIRRMDEDPFCCGIQGASRFGVFRFTGHGPSDGAEAYECLETVQDRLLQEGIQVDYVPCRQVREGDFSRWMKERELVIWTPRLTKEMVVDCARRERLFAPKATRHLIPARPLNVNVPTHWFREDISPGEINDRFRRFLEGKEMKRIGPGQVIDGRYYEEELFVFYERRAP